MSPISMMDCRDMFRWEWEQDLLPHVEDWFNSKDFKEDIKMTHKKHSTADKPTYEESHWKGSEHTAAMVAAQIAARYGEEEAQRYDPETNCFTLPTWNAKGFKVKKGEHALISTTIITKAGEEDSGDGGKPTTYPKRVYLFYIKQVEPIKKDEEQVS